MLLLRSLLELLDIIGVRSLSDVVCEQTHILLHMGPMHMRIKLSHYSVYHFAVKIRPCCSSVLVTYNLEMMLRLQKKSYRLNCPQTERS